MIYVIKINYNELGIKLTGKECYFTQIERETKLSDDEFKEFVENEVPKQMIASASIMHSDLGSVKVGDLVKLVETKTKPYMTETNETVVRIIEINETGIRIENYKNRFDLLGTEITRKKKDVATIEIPTKEDVKRYRYNIERDELLDKFEEIVINNRQYYDVDNNTLRQIIKLIDCDAIE